LQSYQENITKLRKALEDKQRTLCTFKPDMSKSEKYYGKLENFKGGPPKGYDEQLKHMQLALKERQAKLDFLKELELRPDDWNVTSNAPSAVKSSAPKRKLILNLKVNIDESSSGHIMIHEGDHPKLLAYSFAKKHNLGNDMRDELEELIGVQIRQHVNKKSSKNSKDISPAPALIPLSPPPNNEVKVEEENTKNLAATIEEKKVTTRSSSLGINI
jgi:hypothetical protein